MKKDLDYYLSLNYPLEVYSGENEIGDAFLVEYVDFDIKASSEDYEEGEEVSNLISKEEYGDPEAYDNADMFDKAYNEIKQQSNANK